MEDWSEIGVMHRRDKVSRRESARRLGISRTMVDRALASDDPPRYARPPVEVEMARMGCLKGGVVAMRVIAAPELQALDRPF